MKPQWPAFALTAALAGCGGGGGSDHEAAASVSVPLASAVALYVDQTLSSPVAISGTAVAEGQSVAISGTGTYSEATASSTFEGQPALQKSTALTATLTVGDTTVPVASAGQTYFDTSRRPLGASGPQAYCVTTSVSAIPATATVGATGPWYSMECYSSSSKILRVGTVTASYVVEADTPSSALVKLITQTNPAGGPSIPVTSTYRVSTTGTMIRLEDTMALSVSGVMLSLKVVYR